VLLFMYAGPVNAVLGLQARWSSQVQGSSPADWATAKEEVVTQSVAPSSAVAECRLRAVLVVSATVSTCSWVMSTFTCHCRFHQSMCVDWHTHCLCADVAPVIIIITISIVIFVWPVRLSVAVNLLDSGQ